MAGNNYKNQAQAFTPGKGETSCSISSNNVKGKNNHRLNHMMAEIQELLAILKKVKEASHQQLQDIIEKMTTLSIKARERHNLLCSNIETNKNKLIESIAELAKLTTTTSADVLDTQMLLKKSFQIIQCQVMLIVNRGVPIDCIHQQQLLSVGLRGSSTLEVPCFEFDADIYENDCSWQGVESAKVIEIYNYII